MPRFHSLSWTLLAAAGFALAAAPTTAPARQPAKDDLPRLPSAVASEVANLKVARGITNMEKAKKAFAQFAQYNADYISYPRVYTAAQEFRPDVVQPGSLPVPHSTAELITELSRHILVPTPVQVSGNKPTPDEIDYIRELGIALDAALKEVIEKNPEPIIRMNATRMLAAACRSGATAHYPTVTELISAPNVRPEVKYYAIQAAANLLAAYDVNALKSRQHSNKPKEVAALITVLQEAVLKPETLVPPPPGKLTPEQAKAHAKVLSFFRLHAIRALAQVRFAEFKVTSEGPILYPSFTLARVAASDPALVPPPSEAEVAEAVLGICNMTPPRGQAAIPYGYAMADAVATGLVTFATPRAGSQADKSLPWKGYGARLNDALKLWKGLFDANYDPTNPNRPTADVAPKPVLDLVTQADQRVLTPMEGTGTPDVQGLRRFRDDKSLRGDPKWTTAPFLNKPDLVLPKGN